MALHVVTDSTSYLPASDLARLGIAVVPLFVTDGDTVSAETDLAFGEHTHLIGAAMGDRVRHRAEQWLRLRWVHV